MVSSVVEGVGFSVVEGVMFFVLEGVVFDTDGFLCRIFWSASQDNNVFVKLCIRCT